MKFRKCRLNKAERIAKNVIFIEYSSNHFLDSTKTESTVNEILRNLNQIYERKSLAIQLIV